MSLNNIIRVFKSVNIKQSALTISYCPLCSGNRVIIRLYQSEIAVRCLFCKATSVTMSLVSILNRMVPDISDKDVYELSSRGPLVSHLKKNCGQRLTCSEYFEDMSPGEYRNGIQCQDVQRLTFADNSFDVCTSTEVFEHVPDDLAGFAEVRRVLRPRGVFLFTVPLFPSDSTVVRTVLTENQKLCHLLPEQYHGDPIRGYRPILVFRDYGLDIKERILSQGFNKVELLRPSPPPPWNYGRTVIVAS